MSPLLADPISTTFSRLSESSAAAADTSSSSSSAAAADCSD
jgi:hypothetical protein